MELEKKKVVDGKGYLFQLKAPFYTTSIRKCWKRQRCVEIDLTEVKERGRIVVHLDFDLHMWLRKSNKNNLSLMPI